MDGGSWELTCQLAISTTEHCIHISRWPATSRSLYIHPILTMATTFPKDLEAEGSDDVVQVSPHSWRVIRDAEEPIQSANRVIDLNIIDPSVLSDPNLELNCRDPLSSANSLRLVECRRVEER